MRANPAGFAADSYKVTMTYNQTLATVTPCVYPACTSATIAALDSNETGQAIRTELPLGGMRVTCNVACTGLDGDIWVIWKEPSTFAAFDSTNSDECPNPTDAPTFDPFDPVKPRCVHIRFHL
jgi:hypothetical protein